VTTGCTDAEKVRFAAHLLEGPAASWWDTYQTTHPIDGVTWDSFQEGVRAAHISAGVMSLKKKEFRDLKQRHYSVSEYIDEFTNLSRYTPDDIDTDAKRKEKFLEGLNDELSIPLSVAYTPTFQALLDQAIILENKMKQSESRKRKHHTSKYHEPMHKYNFHVGSGGSRFHKNGGNNQYNNSENGREHHKANGHHHDDHKSHHHHFGRGNGNNHRGINGYHNDNNLAKKDLNQIKCFKCHEIGHYAKDCTENGNNGRNFNENGRNNNNNENNKPSID
jgi:hypothetical protein